MIAAMQAKLDALEQSFRDRMFILYSRPSALLEPLKPFSGKANSQSWVDFEAAFVTRMHAAHVPRSEWVLNALAALAADPLKWSSNKLVTAQTSWEDFVAIMADGP